MRERSLVQVVSQAHGGGLETVVRWIADEAADRGWDSHVVHYRGTLPGETRATYTPIPAGVTVPTWPLHLMPQLRRLHPSIVHLHGPNVGSLGAFAARMAGARRIIFTDHEVHSERVLKYRAARRLAARIPAMNIAASEAGARSLIFDCKVPPDRVKVIRNATTRADPVAPPDGEVPRLIYVANYWPRKAHATLLRAMTLLADPVRLVLVGRGLDRVVARARSMGLGERVEAHPYAADPWSFAEGAWAYVHPAHLEGLPLAILEAMMRGLPVIACHVAGIPEVVRDGRTGMLVPPHDPVSLAAGLRGMLSDRAMRDRMAVEARSFALKHLNLDLFLNEHFRLYEQLLWRG